MSSASSLFSLNNLSTYTRQFFQLLANLMLVNYLTHGINLQQDPSSAPPQDALNAIFGQSISSSDLNALHTGTYLTAGLVGIYNVVSQVQGLAAPGVSPAPAPTSSSSSQSSSGLGI